MRKERGISREIKDSRGVRSHIRDSPPTLRHVVVDGSLTRSRKLEEGKTSARWTRERTRARKRDETLFQDRDVSAVSS